MNKILERLDLTIQRKITESPKKSHTAKLFSKGTEKCAEKFGEEAIELIVACVKKKKREIKRKNKTGNKNFRAFNIKFKFKNYLKYIESYPWTF